MTTPDDQAGPADLLHVHVASVAAGAQLAAAAAPASPPRPRRRRATLRTVLLTAKNPVLPILGEDLERVALVVQATGTNDVILCEDNATAQAATSADPGGTVIPHTNTAPVEIPTTDQLWATALTFPAQLSITAVSRALASP